MFNKILLKKQGVGFFFIRILDGEGIDGLHVSTLYLKISVIINACSAFLMEVVDSGRLSFFVKCEIFIAKFFNNSFISAGF